MWLLALWLCWYLSRSSSSAQQIYETWRVSVPLSIRWQSSHLLERRKARSFLRHLISNVMVLDINMLYPGVEDWVVCQGDEYLIFSFHGDDNSWILRLHPTRRAWNLWKFHPTSVTTIVADGFCARVVLRDLDERVLLIGLKKAQFGQEESSRLLLLLPRSEQYIRPR